MGIAKKTGMSARKTVQSCLVFGLFVLEISSPLATANECNFSPTRFKLQSKREAPVPSQTTDSKEKTTFQLILISDGTLCPLDDLNCADRDIWWKNFGLRALDGHTLYLTSIPFPDVERSKKHLQASIRGADKILRRDAESDSKGEIIGERALGSFSPVKDMKGPLSTPHYRLFWTWSKNYWEIGGEHLEDVQALESRLKEEGVNAVWTWHKPYVR